MKSDFSPSLRTSQTDLSPLKRAESSPRQVGASSFETSSPVSQTGGTTAVRQSDSGGIDAALARQGSNVLERILSQYGSGFQSTSGDVSAVKGKGKAATEDPFQRLDSLNQQVGDLFQRNPSVIDQIRADKELSTSLQRIATRMLDRASDLPQWQRDIFMSFAALAREIDPVEPKPILP